MRTILGGIFGTVFTLVGVTLFIVGGVSALFAFIFSFISCIDAHGTKQEMIMPFWIGVGGLFVHGVGRIFLSYGMTLLRRVGLVRRRGPLVRRIGT